jgi:hypothetical protein
MLSGISDDPSFFLTCGVGEKRTRGAVPAMQTRADVWVRSIYANPGGRVGPPFAPIRTRAALHVHGRNERPVGNGHPHARYAAAMPSNLMQFPYSRPICYIVLM